MAWLFERTVEAAAWLAMVVAWASFVLAVWWFIQWCGTLQGEPNHQLLRDSAQAAAAAVGFALGLGGLACVDRFLFDADDVR